MKRALFFYSFLMTGTLLGRIQSVPSFQEDEAPMQKPPSCEVTFDLQEDVRGKKEEPIPCQKREKEFFIEAKAGYFWPFSSLFSDIYGGSGIYGLEFLMALPSCDNPFYNALHAWLGVDYFEKSGQTLGDPRFSTKLVMVPITFGVKWMPSLAYSFNKECSLKIRPYLGIGMEVSYLSVKNHTPVSPTTFYNWGVGGILQAGALFDITKWFFIDIFSTFSYIRVDSVNISGGSLGAGLGVSW
jgi:hypothetical protein